MFLMSAERRSLLSAASSRPEVSTLQNLNPRLSSSYSKETPMSTNSRLTYSMPGRSLDDEENLGYGMINDSFGSVHLADSTGLDEEMETGDAKTGNFPTRED
jgi:hypothetical protein